MMKKFFQKLFIIGLILFIQQAIYSQEILKFVIMASQDPKIEMPKYLALSNFLKNNIKEIETIDLQVANDYKHAVELFKNGKADGIISGSFVAAILIKKGLAFPVARPIDNKGNSTYRALIIAKKGTKKFNDIEDFRGKKIAYTSLASSGEIFVRSLLKGKPIENFYTPVIVKKHQIALNAVSSGEADFAVVKNLIWEQDKYQDLIIIGEDFEENPNDTIILTEKIYKKYGDEILTSLLLLEKDNSVLAKDLKEKMGIKGYLKTTIENFSHTYLIIKNAKIIPKDFDFKF
ncbi:MAG: hypothetical protein A2086_03235 [Spirochaetes bacterium GWD1_27_9]|nr:MAG: hypothetical protein A2Z98_12910 [Spirochaetes bacterium GWB1_27_13]OHD26846.1 MAG: hypothetical protein A2Y34_15775 [Spirochaetes bacterium GWC1_27_15]OHD38711.1 MAG: hypothetical protein A2086_03235 [Spirochaetes bacterium GWD1_27_9]